MRRCPVFRGMYLSSELCLSFPHLWQVSKRTKITLMITHILSIRFHDRIVFISVFQLNFLRQKEQYIKLLVG